MEKEGKGIAIQTLEGDLIEVPPYAQEYCFLLKQYQESFDNETSLWPSETVSQNEEVHQVPFPSPIEKPDSSTIIRICFKKQ